MIEIVVGILYGIGLRVRGFGLLFLHLSFAGATCTCLIVYLRGAVRGGRRGTAGFVSMLRFYS